jgi:hypothetical protein
LNPIYKICGSVWESSEFFFILHLVKIWKTTFYKIKL